MPTLRPHAPAKLQAVWDQAFSRGQHALASKIRRAIRCAATDQDRVQAIRRLIAANH